MSARSISQSTIVCERITMAGKSSLILDGRIPRIILERIEIKEEFDTWLEENVAAAMNDCDGHDFATVKVKEEFIPDEERTKENSAVDVGHVADDSRIFHMSQDVNQISQSAVSSCRIVSDTMTDMVCCKAKKIEDPRSVTFSLIGHLFEGALKEENENTFEEFFREHLDKVNCEEVDESDENEDQFIVTMNSESVSLKNEELSLDDFSLSESEICANDAAVARCLAESSCRSGLRKSSKPRSYNYPYVCDQCPEKFRYLKDFSQHLKDHDVMSYATPSDINRNQIFFPTYEEHVGLKTEELNSVDFLLSEAEICANDDAVARCLAKSRCRSGLRKKLKPPNHELPYECGLCGDKFCFSEDLNQHLQEHSDDISSAFSSEIYENNENKNPSNFSVNGKSVGLDNEELSFDDISSTESEICSNDVAVALRLAKSSGKSGLRGKVKQRLYKNPYACDQCSNKFRYLKDLNEHLRRHSNVSNSVCAEADENNESRDKCTIPTNEEPSGLECEELPAESSFRTVLKTKSKPRAYNNPYACDQCPDKFCYLEDLKQHFKEHNHGISLVQASGKSVESKEQTLDKFSRSESEIYVKNAVLAHRPAESNRKCVVQRNLKARTYINQYACDQCPAKFRFLRQFNQHLEDHSSDISDLSCVRESIVDQNMHEEIPVVTGTKQHCCAECPLKFRTLGGLRRHLNVHERKDVDKDQKRQKSGRTIYSCVHCPVKCTWKSSLIRHLEIHSGDKLYTCDVCHRQFRHRHSYLRHALVHSAEKPFSCPHCPAKIKTQRYYRLHLLRHSNNKPTCTSFASVSHILKDPVKFLRGKVRDRSNDPSKKPFACEHCPSRFTQNADLVRHITNVHGSNREYQCQVCPRTFFHLSSLKRHSQSHLDVDLHKCDFCPATFNEKRLLKNHLMVHFSGKWLMCAICFCRFRQKSLLRAHLGTCTGSSFLGKSGPPETLSQHLTVNKRFSCAHCAKRFTLKSSLQRHLSTYSHSHRAQHSCVHCSKVFWNKQMLKRHMQMHSMEILAEEQKVARAFDEDTMVDVDL